MTISKKVSEEPPSQAGEIAEGDIKAVKDAQACVHFDKCLNLDKVFDKIKSSRQIKCEECKEEAYGKRGTEVVKLISGRSWNNLASSDIEEQFSGTGSITTDSKLEGVVTSGIEAKDGYVVRGLVNLGNTCFFNSIIQNLLALDQLRNHFLKEDGFGVGGPLASSLKKLFAETKPEAGLTSVIDPKAFFESFCSKVPQFKGYDQHDSHELLRCLLDSLSTEESALRKKRGDSDEDHKSTLIDSLFRGETSSIVSCMECEHSSKVYEPFLDLSLPLPFKKTSLKKPLTVSRSKNAKLPPKRSFKNVSKVSNGPTLESPGVGENSSLVNPWDMPYKDISSDHKTVAKGECEASSSFEPQNNDYVDFSGFFEEPEMTKGPVFGNNDYVDFSGFFDEPEMTEGPVFGPPSKAEASGVGFMAFSSESDPEEIDDSDSPVSVERCLAHFTKPEILSNDNAWHCENCSKNLKLQQLREKLNYEKDEYRSSNASKGVKEHESENGVLGETDVLAVIQDPSDTCCAKDHIYNGRKATRDYSANESDFKGAQATPPKDEKDEHRSSNASKGVKEHKSVSENGVFGETNLLAAMQDPSDTCSVKDHSSNVRKATRPYSANESDSKGAQDEDKDSEKLITVKRDATKKVLINKAPPVLTIHLKRFSQDLRGRLSKLNGHIAFKEVIDLRQYMDSRCNEEGPPVYRLAGLVEHSGTMRGGHYVAYVRGAPRAKETDSSSKAWYNVSDANVRQVSLETVLHSEAYILFYERIFSQD